MMDGKEKCELGAESRRLSETWKNTRHQSNCKIPLERNLSAAMRPHADDRGGLVREGGWVVAWVKG